MQKILKMKLEKNNFFWKKAYFLLIKIGLWLVVGFVFTNISLIIPINSGHFFKELIVFFCLAAMVIFHTSYLYSILLKKNWWGYITICFVSILCCAGLEMFIFYDNLVASYNTFPNTKTIFYVTFTYIVIRDLAIFLFFHWIEYSNRLTLLYYQSEKVHQEEILLLKEKQEFEKNYSKKTLLPHYFFNILEYVGVNSLSNKNNKDILDKFKFILYYFLVDADKDLVELDKEIVFYKYYIELEKLRHQKNILVNFNVLGQIENYFIIPLLFEPIIGNAMKYTKQDGTGWVNIQIDTTCFPNVQLYCKNNCILSNTNIVSSEKGLKIFKQRLELCYKDNYTLKIEQSGDFFEVTLTIVLV